MKLDRFITRPVLSTVISILVVILGVLGLVSLPIEQYPNMAPPTVMVRAAYSGANSQTVLNSVLAPLEEQINGVEGMTYMTSSATNDGSASITVFFKQGMDPDMCQVNVQNRVSQASALLPAEVTKAGVTVMKRQSSTVILFGLTADDDRYDDKFLTNYANINVVPAIKRVNGVGECQCFSQKDYTMRLWIDPVKMKSYGLIPSDLTGVLAQQNIEAAPGSVGEQSDNQYQYTFRYRGRLQTPEEFGNMIIKSTQDGQTIRVKDVARVEMGALSYTVESKNNGKPSVTMMVTQTAGSNATEIATNVKKLLKEQEATMPPGIHFDIMQDVTEFLFASIEDLIKTLCEAFILVFIVVYIFLQDWRSTLIPLIAVPVSLVGTFFFLYAFGFSLNLLTLAALVLAIAIVVDDAIVVVEAVRLASKLVPDAAFCVGGSFCAPVRDGWADLLLNIFSPMAEAEFARMLRPGGHLVYAVPTARHLFGLKEILYDCPYENEVRQTEYDGFAFVKAVESTAVITLEGQSVQDLFAMTPYYWNTPADGAARLAECERLTTEIGFRFLVYQKV